MNSCINKLDTEYFDYLLKLAILATKAPNSNVVQVTIPEPPITHYDPVYYPQSTSIFPEITTFNSFDQFFDFGFALSKSSINHTPPDSNKQCKQGVVTKPVFPENTGLISFDSADFSASSFPSTSSNRSRPRRTALKSRYAKYWERFQTLTKDPFILAIMKDENRVLCAGCENYIQLDRRRTKSLYLQNWKRHKGRCVGITTKVRCKTISLSSCLQLSDSSFFFFSSQRHESRLYLDRLG